MNIQQKYEHVKNVPEKFDRWLSELDEELLEEVLILMECDFASLTGQIIKQYAILN